jgi:hypothetical protein
MRVGLLNRIFVAHNLMPKSWEPCSVVGTVTWILFRLWALLQTHFVYILYYRIFKFNVKRSVHRKYIPLDIFPTRCNITQFIYLWKTALHVSSGISKHHQEHIQSHLQYLVLVNRYCYLRVLWESCYWSHSDQLQLSHSRDRKQYRLTSTRYCKCSWMCSWWCVEIPPETCRAVSQK